MSDVTELRVSLTVKDFDQAVAFYRDGLGLTQLEDWSSDRGRVVLLEAGQRVSGAVRIAVEVADSGETARRLVEAGAGHVAPPVLTPWGDRNARVETPDGMQLTLFGPP